MKNQISVLSLMKKMVFAVVMAFILLGSGATAVAKDDPKELESNCDAGNLDACVQLGSMFENGPTYDNVPKDEARAVSLFQKACDGGDSEGCKELGMNYKFGKGVQEDLAHAFTLFEKACAGESSSGCYYLGQAYEDGDGVPEDPALAFSHFEQACNLGSESGCWSIAVLHHPQKGTLKDAARWAVFMEKACNLGHWQGQTCRTLGLVFDLGVWGVPKDSDHATELFKKGCLYGDKEACDLITR